MTIEQFNKHGFKSRDKVRYTDGNIYDVASVDFKEKLVGLLMNISGGEEGDVTWVRCENVELL